MEELLRKFIDRTSQVYKLKITLCNYDIRPARYDGNLNLVKEIIEKQNTLAAEFREWRTLIKKRSSSIKETPESIEEFRRNIRHAELEAQRLCDEIDQKENAQAKNCAGDHLSETMICDRSNVAKSSLSIKQERTDDKYPLKKEELDRRLSTPLDEHLKLARSYSRAEITSEIKTEISGYNDEDNLFSVSWIDFTSSFLPENRSQHFADRLIASTIFKFASHYWKQIKPVLIDGGLAIPEKIRMNEAKHVQWIKERLTKLQSISFMPFSLPRMLEQPMIDYTQFINDAVIEASFHVLQCSLFDSFRTARLSEFCANPTSSLFKELIIDEITKSHTLFNNRQVCFLPENRSHLERLTNETTMPINKWMLEKVRIQHQINKFYVDHPQ